MKHCFLALTFSLGVGLLPAQLSLTTTLLGGNGQNGAMFDITNISGNPVTITSFDQSFFTAGTSALFEIWFVTTGTSYVGFENNAAGWTMAGSTPNLAHPTVLTAVPVPIAVNVTIPPGATQGFYCTSSNGTIAYTNGTVVGNVFASDAFIQFREGVGKAYPFGGSFTPRVWNGIINYQAGGTVVPLFQVNQLNSSLDVNGTQGSAFGKARTQVCTGATVTFNSIGLLGQAWEAVLSPASTISATTPGSAVTPAGQIVNLDLTQPIIFLNGGPVLVLLPYPGNFAAPVNAGPVAQTISAMQIMLDPSSPDFYTLSQSLQLDITGAAIPAGPIAGPTLDDSEVAINVGCVSVFGTAYSQIFIESNGRIMFGVGNTGFGPSAALIQSQSPSCGVWTDFNPANGGTITATQPTPGVLDVAYANLAYFTIAAPSTFNLIFDTNTNVFSITGLNTIGLGGGAMLIGLSGGNAVGATDAGQAMFSPGGLPNVGITSNATDMIYMLGTQGTVTTGITRIDFTPNAFGNYDWATL